MPAVLSTMGGPVIEPQSRTRRGAAYGLASAAPPRLVVCPASFSISQSLQAAVDEEGKAPPDIEQYFAPKRASVEDTAPAQPAKCAPPPGLSSREEFDFTSPLLPPGSFTSAIPPVNRLVYHYNARVDRDKARKHAKRVQQRAQDFAANRHEPRPDTVRQHVETASTIPAKVALEELPANKSGYEALTKDSGERKELSFEELAAEGYEVLKWDGKESLALVDASTRRAFVACVGMPDDPTYAEDCKMATECILETAQGEEFLKTEWEHKRGGHFPVFNAGILAGHGPQAPYNLRNAGHEGAVEALLENKAIRRLALFQDAAFKLYAPNLYDYYHHHTIPLRNHMPSLRVNWDLSVFSAAAFNLGPQVVTYFHRDCMNLAFGWCAIHALGNFDHTKGGHLVLKELKLMIEFPPGALILVPSATITHGNTPIQADEIRLSFTQYSSGAAFRFVDNGYRTIEQLKNADKAAYQKMLEAKADRWKLGLGLWSTVDEILLRFGIWEDGEIAE